MKYVVLDNDRVIDILTVNPMVLYDKKTFVVINDEVEVGVGMVYDSKSGVFLEYVEPVQEPTQLDRVEANIDYLVLINS